MNQPQNQDPLYSGPRPGARNQFNARSPPPNQSSSIRMNGGTEEPTDGNRNRAARYEDEKKRIIDSCFAKKDDDGVAAESYITHVRILEDGAYPSSPPPPDSAAANKKDRVILVAVRRTGRVRVHKARENPTGTFSIGKTWPLEDLSSIVSYTHFVARNNLEQSEKQWAGGVGFVVTLGKPYYWQASTPKEKDFFIGSLVKIFRKYTGGKVPELSGFAPHEVELLTGARPSQSPANQPGRVQSPPTSTQAVPSPPPPIPTTSDKRPQSPHSTQSQGADSTKDSTGRLRAQSRNEQTPPARDAQRPPPIEPLRSPVRNDDRQVIRDGRNQRPYDAPQRPPMPDSTSSTAAFHQLSTTRATPSPQSSQASLPSEKQNGRALNGIPRPPQIPYTDSHQSTASSIHSASSRPSTAVSERRPSESRPDKVAAFDESSLDSRRPVMPKKEPYLAAKSVPQSESNSQFATPAASPSDLKEIAPLNITSISQDQPKQTPIPVQEKDYFNQNKSSTSEAAQSSTISTEISKTPKVIETASNAASSDVSTEAEPTLPPTQLEEEHRPGLGPMVKKKSAKDIAGQFRRAVMAANAFQPRQGGAGARLKALQDKDKTSNEPDGITSVVPAPLLRGISSDALKSPAPTTPVTATSQEQHSASTAGEVAPRVQIYRSVTDDNITTPDTPAPETPVPVVNAISPDAGGKPEPKQQIPAPVRAPSPERARSRSPQRRKRQRQEAEITKYCSALGIDLRVLDGKGADFNDLLTEFGWKGRLVEEHRIDDFEAEIKREIGRAQATGWLGHVEQQEGKVHDLAKAFDKAIEECEELDGLFTLYSHELDTLAADIEYIEAQSQGLQVQTANQKLLQSELNNLLRTLTIPSSDLRGLQAGSLDTVTGVETVERSLTLLYRALLTIDPDIRQNRIRQAVSSAPERTGIGIYADTEVGQMRAVREKKDEYREATMSFVKRFNQHMTSTFKIVDDKMLQEERQRLWKYNTMMLFVREVNSYEWQTLITSYEMSLRGTYQTQFRDFAMDNRKVVRKPGNDELEALFTTQEKEKPDETLASSAARKLTVKRGKTVKAGALRHQLGERRGDKPDAWEVFDTVLKKQSSIVSEEQNFIVCFFHLNSQESTDFTEIVASKSPSQRTLPNLNARQSYDPDRNMAKIVQGVVEGIYSFWLGDLQGLLEWALGMNPLQGIGILFALEQNLAYYEETNQEYITRTVRTLHERLTGLFHKFVDEQIKAIEETKVKVKKRKGIISFMRTFPAFSTTVEHILPADMTGTDALEVRFIVNDAYTKILKAMWESLNFIAKDDPAGGASQSAAPLSGDPEDKEALNYQILLIENMNHYLEEVETQRNPVLEEWAEKARQDFSLHLTQYTDAVIRRPLGKWLDFLESTEAVMKSPEIGGIANKPSHSRSAAKKVLSSHDGKEIKKGVETLKKRIEKHFGDVDDPSTASRSLILRVQEECNARYASAHERMKAIIDRVYDGSLDIDWRPDEVAALFKR